VQNVTGVSEESIGISSGPLDDGCDYIRHSQVSIPRLGDLRHLARGVSKMILLQASRMRTFA